MNWATRRTDKEQWHPWFAIFPVKVSKYTLLGVIHSRWMWLETVQRKIVYGWTNTTSYKMVVPR